MVVRLEELVVIMDQEFALENFGKDPAFSRFLPDAYDSVLFDWKSQFEFPFTQRFNGLLIKGSPFVHRIFLAVFPTDHVLEHFIEKSSEGDLLFMHHPLLMECGDPRGRWGKGFVPIKENWIRGIKDKKLSVYTCHVPLDYHSSLGTSAAIARILNAEIVDGLVPIHVNKTPLILICHIDPTDTNSLIHSLKQIFEIPYVDFDGQKHPDIQKIAIVAGCGDKVHWMEAAEKKGVHAYITGEIHCHIDNAYGREKFSAMKEFASTTSMSLIGVSHSASEYLVKKTLIKEWLEHTIGIETVLIPQEKWWL
ncbi:Nif3-like dinuclear metal center hexameric protein [Peribacillus deserti]|uniref:GTP cyclohydrolase 1 type 2 homolog n=1 Tax=Peribacillus deserti TaxID=673318 RepID=A0A2N5M3F5_9BACI|nr:Nif3-like dinuclear metal center hexameric protein [Peribacillus deserti]PLT28855.1 hypothetical protein CUU66_16020 [Peribacillus deserti]